MARDLLGSERVCAAMVDARNSSLHQRCGRRTAMVATHEWLASPKRRVRRERPVTSDPA